MKKKVLLSVFAASLFAAAPAALAQEVSAPNGVTASDNAVTGTSKDDSHDLTFEQVTPEPFNKAQVDSSKAKTGKANNANVDKDGVLREKGPKAPKAPAKGQKALPKTSAVK